MAAKDYCVRYVRPRRGRGNPASIQRWGQWVLTGEHIAGCYDKLRDARRRLEKITAQGKCQRNCGIYERQTAQGHARERMIWPRKLKRWKRVY